MSTANVGGAMTSRYPRALATARSTCTGSVEPTASANSRILAEPTAYGWVGGYSRPTKSSLTGIRETLVGVPAKYRSGAENFVGWLSGLWRVGLVRCRSARTGGPGGPRR